ncbi:MAG: ATP-binding cassette domain-containing protein [Actinobacteria bacterium]|nr:ATP-binding cassette domain-containing protein [Actinomycetota bacterium]
MEVKENNIKSEYILEAIGVTKHFGGVYALDNVDLRLKYNEVLGIVGDNGAGKSTLIKIISGFLQKNDGEIYFEGEKVEINNPKDAYDLGIETVYQDLSLIDVQNATFNIFLGREVNTKGPLRFLGVLNDKFMLKETQKLMDLLNINLGNLKKPMSDFSGGQRQAVAISKSVYWGKKVAILDEPTAALGVKESARVLEFIKSLKERSHLSIIIISHNMQHIFSVVDRIMVLRRGKLITVQNAHEVTSNDIVKYITGSDKVVERV